MPNVNKVVFGNQTLIDLTNSTLSSADQLAQGVTAYDRGGNLLTGTASGGTAAISVVDTLDSHGGTIRTITGVDISSDTVTAAHLEQGYTAHDAEGNAILGTLVAGGGGLEYESGTWTPSQNVASTWISFTNTHTVAPFFFSIWDNTGTYDDTTNSQYMVTYFNNAQVFGSPMYTSDSSLRYASAVRGYRLSNATSITNQTTNITAPYTDTSDSSTSYSRFWAKETGIKAESYSSSVYWRAGRTYKWIAVWAPTT